MESEVSSEKFSEDNLEFVVTREDPVMRMLALMSLSEAHAKLTIRWCAQYLIPAVLNESYRFMRYKGQICGYVIYAKVDRRTHDQLVVGKFPVIRNEQWKAGEYYWILDLITPSTASNQLALWAFLDAIKQRVCNNEEIFLHAPAQILAFGDGKYLPDDVSIVRRADPGTSVTVLSIK